jgi:hypothetical protein
MFGSSPPAGVLVLCYFLGQATQVILTYQVISTWLPAVPGAVAYLRLRRAVAAWRTEGAIT